MSLPFSPASSLTAMERFCFSECCYYIGLNIFLSCIFTMCIVDPFFKNRYLDFSNSADLKLSPALLSFHKKLGPPQNFELCSSKDTIKKMQRKKRLKKIFTT